LAVQVEREIQRFLKLYREGVITLGETTVWLTDLAHSQEFFEYIGSLPEEMLGTSWGHLE